MRLPLIACIVLLAAPAFATSSACKKELSDEWAARKAKDKILPAMGELCRSLGISSDAKCDETAILEAGQKQTDPSKWYNETSNWLNPDCRNPIAIKTYMTIDGDAGTKYACLAPAADDRITDDDINRIAEYAKRLNSINPKTLEDHHRAMWLKSLVRTLGG